MDSDYMTEIESLIEEYKVEKIPVKVLNADGMFEEILGWQINLASENYKNGKYNKITINGVDYNTEKKEDFK